MCQLLVQENNQNLNFSKQSLKTVQNLWQKYKILKVYLSSAVFADQHRNKNLKVSLESCRTVLIQLDLVLLSS